MCQGFVLIPLSLLLRFFFLWLRLGFLSVHEPLHSLGELEKQQGAKTRSFKSGGAQVDPQLKQGSPTGEPWPWSGVSDPRPGWLGQGGHGGHLPPLGVGSWGLGMREVLISMAISPC